MKRTFRAALFSIFTLGLSLGMLPAQAAAASRHDDDRYHREYRDDRHDRYERGRPYDRGYYEGGDRYYGNYGYSYVAPAYPPAQYYDGGGYYYHRDGRAGRSAAIIGGSAAAGAVIGAAADHGQGAAIGAIVGGIAGVVADQAVRHHDYR